MVTPSASRPSTRTPTPRRISWGARATGSVRAGLFGPAGSSNLSLPHGGIQAATAEEIVAIRAESHPWPGKVRVERVEQTDRGFTLEFEERWDNEGQRWYCREMIRADVVGDSILQLAIFCTGYWDDRRQVRHREAVHLIRP